MRLLRILGLLLLLIVVLALGAFAWATSVANGRLATTWTVHDATFPIPWPLLDAERDSVVKAGGDVEAAALASAVARGTHLIESRVACSGCHGADLGGHVVINVPVVGYWAGPNLTGGEGSVTRAFTARDWDRAVRHGVRHDGRTSTMPCNDFQNLSDRELSDVVAYIQSRPPVHRDVGPVRLGPVFTFLLATDPKQLSAFSIDHAQPHAAEPPVAAVTTEFGEHLVQVCRGCHGPNLSGGKLNGDPNMPLVANITPHASGLQAWTEADFVRAMKEGKRPDGSAIQPQMPWQAYGKMTDAELAAIWAYLRTVPPVEKGKR